ncbi:hypothetical protein KKF91_16130 [Myxococcota bacterium]|nr:hypothetical protein [Myxococcota bacterium]MBU1432069.1 hypothetical protein [Myxococcota bacterium]MBU1898401.1 hypothetical protein [Myxococcota bacterium]
MTSLPLPLNVALLLLGGALGALDARRVRRAHPDLRLESGLEHARHLLLVLVPLIALLIAHFYGQRHPLISWRFPIWLELHYTAIVWGIILMGFSFIFSFGLATAFVEGHRERWKLALASALLIGAVQWSQWYFTRPAIPGPAQISEGVILQTHGSTCAAASGANLMTWWGQPMSEAEMIALMGTTDRGTSTAQIITGLARLGVECRKAQHEGPLALTAPAILFVDHPTAGAESHAVLYVGARDGIVEYLDPVDGRHRVEPSVLKAIWPGRAVECQRGAPWPALDFSL